MIALRVLDGRHNVIGALQPLLDAAARGGLAHRRGRRAFAVEPAPQGLRSVEAAPSPIPTYPLEGDELAALIQAAAEEAGMTIEPGGARAAFENLGGDRLAIRGELEKLFLYLGDRRHVTVDAVEAIVGDTTAAKTDHAIDAALLGDNEALETTLARLRAEGGSPSALGALALRHLMQLQIAARRRRCRRAAVAGVDSARPPIFGRRRPTVEAEIERWPSDAIVDARQRIDRAVMLMRLQPALEDGGDLRSAARHRARPRGG